MLILIFKKQKAVESIAVKKNDTYFEEPLDYVDVKVNVADIPRIVNRPTLGRQRTTPGQVGLRKVMRKWAGTYAKVPDKGETIT